jgi:hypothetical protein
MFTIIGTSFPLDNSLKTKSSSVETYHNSDFLVTGYTEINSPLSLGITAKINGWKHNNCMHNQVTLLQKADGRVSGHQVEGNCKTA